MEYLIGAGMALSVAVGATLIGFDRDRSFYPTILVVIASTYDLFAAMGGSPEAFAIEGFVLAGFIGISVIGFRTNLWLVVAGLFAHGMLDLVHGDLIINPGVPAWWPTFCMTYDVAAAGYLGWLLVRPGKARLQARRARIDMPSVGAEPTVAGASFGERIRPFVDEEFRAAAASEAAGDPATSFRHLERAHVLGQASTIQHVRAHFHMLVWGIRHRNTGEIVAQVLRIASAATMTAIKGIPFGNTGGSSAGAFQSMPIPKDLAAIIAAAKPTVGRRLGLGLIAVALLGGCNAMPTDVHMANVDGRSIAYCVLGAGHPTLVMISGLGDGMESFEDIAPELAKGVTVVVYDRAGYGGSSPARGPQDAAAAERDLSAVLALSGTVGPYVLVGHSLGGLFAEYFAAKHPDQIAGLILEEARPADFARRCEAAKAGMCTPPGALVRIMSAAAGAELASLESIAAEVEMLGPAKVKSVLVLSRPVDKDGQPIDRLWRDAQADLAKQYAGSRHLTAPGGGHYIHRDQSEWFAATVMNFVAGSIK